MKRPPATGDRTFKQWQKYRASIGCWSGVTPGLPTPIGKVAQLLKSQKAINTTLVVSGQSLSFYTMASLSPLELKRAGAPIVQITPAQVRQAFEGVGKIDKNEQGHCLYFVNGLPPEARIFEAKLNDKEVPLNDAQPLVIALESIGNGPVQSFSDDAASGAPDGFEGLLFGSDEQTWQLCNNGTLRTRTPGGGTVVRPLAGADLATADTARAAGILLGCMISDSLDFMKAELREKGRAGAESLESLLQASVLNDECPIQLKTDTVATTNLRKAFGELQRIYRFNGRAARRQLCQIPFGFEPPPRDRLVVAPQGFRGTLKMLDKTGQALDIFYPADKLQELFSGAMGDFFNPSSRVVGWPGLRSLMAYPCDWVSEQVPSRWEAFTFNPVAYFALQRGMACDTAGDFHLAGTLYRDRVSMTFSMPRFDATKPLDSEMLNHSPTALLPALREQLVRAYFNFRTRSQLADLLRRANRTGAADEVTRSLAAEYRAGLVPLMDQMLRYANGYGYELPPFTSAMVADLRKLPIPSLPRTASAPNAGATLDSAKLIKLAKSGQRKPLASALEEFYAQRPTVDLWYKAKVLLVENAPSQVARKPLSLFDAQLAAWRPLAVNVKGEICPASLQEVFSKDASPALVTYREALYAMEVLRDPLLAKAQLINLAIANAPTTMAGTQVRADAPSLAADLNRVGALALAAQADNDNRVTAAMQVARLEPAMLESSERELTTFIKPRLLALGYDGGRVEALLSSATLTLSGDDQEERAQRSYSSQRFYWAEWDHLDAERHAWSDSGMPMDKLTLPAWMPADVLKPLTPPQGLHESTLALQSPPEIDEADFLPLKLPEPMGGR